MLNSQLITDQWGEKKFDRISNLIQILIEFIFIANGFETLENYYRTAAKE